MIKWILIAVIILVIGLVIIILKKQKKKKALFLIQKESQKQTDEAFTEAIQKLSLIKFDKLPSRVHSEFVSDIWGSKVTAFEYSIEVPQITTKDLAKIKKELTTYLTEYAIENRLPSFEGHPVFVVSDIWIFAEVLHIDISHVTNAETWSYIEDVQKSDRTN